MVREVAKEIWKEINKELEIKSPLGLYDFTL